MEYVPEWMKYLCAVGSVAILVLIGIAVTSFMTTVNNQRLLEILQEQQRLDVLALKMARIEASINTLKDRVQQLKENSL